MNAETIDGGRLVNQNGPLIGCHLFGDATPPLPPLFRPPFAVFSLISNGKILAGPFDEIVSAYSEVEEQLDQFFKIEIKIDDRDGPGAFEQKG